MFPGMFMRKPDKAVALKQLKTHVLMFGSWVAVIRVQGTEDREEGRDDSSLIVGRRGLRDLPLKMCFH
ncbi:hypothetical protein F8388_013960 [Cannabis sativa]|uniref:Uncharacterized protein n=1 Tax=Cannabis sativa TaxID=3483 RepID=A0A7J6H8G6_CANSA|nr:hypothetical protein G4B88_030115 [Cannabis sativa]KAF4366895.1 hypothetical protein F8388_013960 [Cannabis sativa]KAF4391554.1 hypothetical protein G4B88_030705 [Cannabis sativa]